MKHTLTGFLVLLLISASSLHAATNIVLRSMVKLQNGSFPSAQRAKKVITTQEAVLAFWDAFQNEFNVINEARQADGKGNVIYKMFIGGRDYPANKAQSKDIFTKEQLEALLITDEAYSTPKYISIAFHEWYEDKNNAVLAGILDAPEDLLPGGFGAGLAPFHFLGIASGDGTGS